MLKSRRLAFIRSQGFSSLSDYNKALVGLQNPTLPELTVYGFYFDNLIDSNIGYIRLNPSSRYTHDEAFYQLELLDSGLYRIKDKIYKPKYVIL